MEENQPMTNEQLESKLKSLRVKATIPRHCPKCARGVLHTHAAHDGIYSHNG